MRTTPPGHHGPEHTTRISDLWPKFLKILVKNLKKKKLATNQRSAPTRSVTTNKKIRLLTPSNLWAVF